ncbi:uncharacterized protein LOC129581643 [Paramacrobiotus metropolitanus]|uniref:uncharacterized protein LOC129581643 n=1 Tax=Paramacrobiotus metropolitanus TaxID=2943436 RepID=UPI00244575E3|nr:uncharacterized protein LOC129581643 [Paramacrobiotus metropolitanus]
MYGFRLRVITAVIAVLSTVIDVISGQCRCLPGNSCWPAEADWDRLNATLYGQLIVPRPTGYPCYAGAGFNATACQAVQQNFANPSFVVNNAGSMQATNWEEIGQARCTFQEASSPSAVCQAGRVSSYGVVASSVADIQNAIAFAHQYNLRVVIKSTGHDYQGRSAAPGSLLIWMHKLANIETKTAFTPNGCDASQASDVPVVTVTGGKVWSEVYKKVEDDFNSGYILVAGHCTTVGAAGGYVLGGGHSILSPSFGLAVDNALEFQIVTIDGVLLTANACQNKDLFWALRGGGGGTFGVLISVTYKLHKINAGYTAYSGLITNTDGSGSLNATQVENILEVMARRTADLDAVGWGGYFYFQPAFGISLTFLIPADRANALPAMDGIKNEIASMGSQWGVVINPFPNTTFAQNYTKFQDWRNWLDSTLVTGIYNSGSRLLPGSRLIPQSALSNSRAVAQTLLAAMNKNGFPFGLLGHLVSGTGVRNNPQANSTSVTPAWRKSAWHIVLYSGWLFNSTDDIIAGATAGINSGIQVLRDAYPDSGAYANEAFIQEPNWQQAFWGENYNRLLGIKKSMDPSGFLVCNQCVGSELWDQAGNCPVRSSSY